MQQQMQLRIQTSKSFCLDRILTLPMAGWGLRPLHVPIGVGGFFGFVLLLCFLVVSFHP